MRLQRRCQSCSAPPEMSKQWFGTTSDRAALLRKWVQHLASQSASHSYPALCPSVALHCNSLATSQSLATCNSNVIAAQVSMEEDAHCVEMSLEREQKTTNSSSRKIMTLADMRIANMSECKPPVCPHWHYIFSFGSCPHTWPIALLQNSNCPGKRSWLSSPRATRSLILIVGPCKVE